MRNRPSQTVSPGTGMRFPVMTMSVFVDPRTTIFLCFFKVNLHRWRHYTKSGAPSSKGRKSLLTYGQHLAHRLAHRLLVAGANRLPVAVTPSGAQFRFRRSSAARSAATALAPQHFLNFFPLPQGHGAFRDIFCESDMMSSILSVAPLLHFVSAIRPDPPCSRSISFRMATRFRRILPSVRRSFKRRSHSSLHPRRSIKGRILRNATPIF